MLRFVQDNNNDIKIITHNFLENGHSMMEVDSMLAAIERETRYIDTFTTNDWKTIFVSSRRKNPYKAKKSDLLELCKKLVIPREFHPWYTNLQTSDALRDSAPEPVAEDTD
ncbi:hypothetical protein RRG08_002284 [Elysia crispata]|uniref:Uncharacterized protein n=1 Tax=Elysia crispata TaxID=231223 RepID=A0AAE0ZC99_9GAST|nr:hypothetical protein RRG08_002284 [Elysia crispata]